MATGEDVAKGALAFFKGRKGFNWWWEEIDDDIREEIMGKFAEEMQALLDK
jgi:hypothetical protein